MKSNITYISLFILAPSRGIVKRVKWTDNEKKIVERTFGNLSRLAKLPSLKECQKLIKTHNALKNRTAEQLKSWIDNQRKAKSRSTSRKKKNGRSVEFDI